MGFLTDLTERVRDDLVRVPLDDGALLERARLRPPARDFTRALREQGGRGVVVIAEVKRASPSEGIIDDDADPVAQALAYHDGGASAISVLTEPRHFHGSLADLDAIRVAVPLPLLRKDFLVHPSQLIESRAHGADAILLIASCLTDDEITALLATADDLGLGVVLETHSEDDLDRALETTAPVIGVNARDLETLEVDTPSALRRLARVPTDRVAVMESGVSCRADVEAAAAAGASAILVGEALMRASDPRAALRTLLGEESTT
jgi:indole-3-glycerol phosphate synthase